jgi:hypothetical protein
VAERPAGAGYLVGFNWWREALNGHLIPVPHANNRRAGVYVTREPQRPTVVTSV